MRNCMLVAVFVCKARPCRRAWQHLATVTLSPEQQSRRPNIPPPPKAKIAGYQANGRSAQASSGARDRLASAKLAWLDEHKHGWGPHEKGSKTDGLLQQLAAKTSALQGGVHDKGLGLIDGAMGVLEKIVHKRQSRLSDSLHRQSGLAAVAQLCRLPDGTGRSSADTGTANHHRRVHSHLNGQTIHEHHICWLSEILDSTYKVADVEEWRPWSDGRVQGDANTDAYLILNCKLLPKRNLRTMRSCTAESSGVSGV
eukprot:359540-Chlamydomonas_euryale.AAC.10